MNLEEFVREQMCFAGLLQKCNNYIITDPKYELKEDIIIGSVHTSKSRNIGADVRKFHENK